MKKQSILVTGGAGFLGCHLARYFLKKKYRVTIFDIADLEAQDLIGKVGFVKGDIRDRNATEKTINEQDYVIHAAAALPIQRKRDLIFSVNVDGARNVLSASLKNKVKRVIFISTTAVYGIPKHLPEPENSPLDPIGFYGESKREAENICLQYFKKGLSVNILRPKSFLGPERLGVFELWFEAIYNGYRVYILGNGKNLYQLLAVSDLADAIEKSMLAKKDGEIFNIGAEEFGTWREDLGYVIKHAESKSKITSIPVLPAQIVLMMLEQLNLSPLSAWHYKTMPIPSYIAIDKAKKILKWQPKKSNKQLLLESFEWYKKNRKAVAGKKGTTHRVGWNFKLLNAIARL